MNVMERKKADAMPAVDEDRLRQLIDERIEAILEEKKKAKTPSLAIIATKGTLDMAYPPFILGSTAMALGWDVSIFFTFYGLELLKKDLELKVSPLGNPAMPMKMPMGPEWFKNIDWPVPNSIASNMPGFESAATALMEKTLVFGFEPDEFIPEIAGWIGAASYLPKSAEADISLFV
jgi:peroxiredoxin family protein